MFKREHWPELSWDTIYSEVSGKNSFRGEGAGSGLKQDFVSISVGARVVPEDAILVCATSHR